MTDFPPAKRAQLAATLYASHKALLFDGLTNIMFCIVGFVNTFPIPRNVPSSVSFWVKNTKNDTTIQQTLMSRWFTNTVFALNEGGWRIYLWDTTFAATPNTTRAMVIQLSTFFLEGIWFHSADSFPFDEWVHVCLTWDGSGDVSGAKMYWNGVEQPTYTVFSNWTSNAIHSNAYSHLMWGAQYTSWPTGGGPVDPPIVTWHYEGLMDETSLWRTELTALQVNRLYHCGYPVSPKNIALPAVHADGHFRMGEWRDGTPWFLDNSICFGRWPVGAPFRNAFWNNDGVLPSLRITEDVSP